MLDDILVNNLGLASIYNYFASITPIFFIWGVFEMAFKIIVSVFSGRSFFGMSDYRLERYSR